MDMVPYSASTHTSGSSSTGQSSLRISTDSLSQSKTPTHSETLKPAKTPRTPRPGQTLAQAFQNTSYSSHNNGGAGSRESSITPHTAAVGGLRAQLHHLLPRHALFHVRVNIHQLASVPLVKGEFGVRWKFKKVKSRKENEKEKHDKGKGKADDIHADTDDDEVHDHTDTYQTSTDDSVDDVHNSHGLPIPSLVVPDNHSTSTSPASTRPVSPNPYAQYLTSDWLPSHLPHSSSHSTHSDSTSRSLSSNTPHDGYAQARGMTPYIKLQDHNVVWEHTLNVVVRMDVDRDTVDLLPNELKLVIMQRVIPGDIDAPHNPRFGAVYLNLAEYANVGPITRRYLLCQSKTNATLKLTVQLEHVGGEKNYKAPPLPKGEILGGIAGILDNDVYRTRPRTLDLYGMYYDNQSKGESQRKGTTLKIGIDPFDISNLSSAYGPRTTETLIEAIFNPVPTHSEKQSPFTYYVPFEPQGKRPSIISSGYKTSTNGSGSLNEPGANESVHSISTSSEYASVYSDSASGKPPSLSSQSARSVSSHGHSSEFGVGGGEENKHKSWWRKIGHSRPTTPGT
ncbi:hypothetical protein PILCRDRAFT_820051 [Piloderma croceum F 1598]|uniref:C2 NT-type domain-containing protein n=1 Tax=Piloderma croceum (strain F 1598) TaxID=765440 RepID=A0A0C3FW29_PILCF|nr:hypothetical protein PILCRDRAFT_820051 [Piloderma croceum F 1598]